MKAKSIKGKSAEEIQSVFQESMADGFKPSLAIVFISIKQDRKAICEIFNKQGINVIGATSCGEFIDGYQDSGSAVILLLNVRIDAYAILFEETGGQNLTEVAKRIAQNGLEKFRKPAFLLCTTGVSSSGEIFSGDEVLRSMEAVVGPNVKIYGGMAGDDGTFTGSYVFTNEEETDEGIAALVFDEEKISLYGMAISGWKPIGIPKTVTKSEGGWIYTIDEQPALEMYFRYLGKEPVPGEDKRKIFEDVGVHYPFQVEGTNDPVMRTPIMVNADEDALKVDFDVPTGTKIRFSVPPDFDIVENILEKATELKENSKAEAEALLIFSCAGRLSALGPLANSENEGLHEVWKTPMAGFFTYGEYGTAESGRQEFHSTTCSWVALKEK